MLKRWSSILLRLVLVVSISPGGNVLGERKFVPVPASRFSPDAIGQSWPHVWRSGSGCDQFEECVPAARCTVQTSGSASLRPCITEFNTDGICCQRNGGPSRLQKRSYDYETVSQNAILEGHREYAATLKAINENRKFMTSKAESVAPFHHFLQSAHPDGDTEKGIYENIFAAKHFAELTNMTLDERQLGHFQARTKRCLKPVRCDHRCPYRSFDGTCNNLHPDRTSWGAAGHPFEKLLPPAYEDGVWAARTHSVTGRPLTSARTISASLLPDIDRPHPQLNLLTMQFGQFIAHDFTRSSSIKLGDKDIECCAEGGFHALQGDQRHFACLPIEVRPDDPFFSKFGVRCLNFVRLALAGDPECRLGYAKQLSKVTHFIDGSPIYGSNEELARSLRTFQKGQLRNSFPFGIEELPLNQDPGVCEPWARVCFEAGDDRVNQVVSLVQVQVLFLREHNRVAGILSHVNPHWSDETVYQEARKIVIAELQRIVYNEYLPLVVGWDKAKQYGLLDDQNGFAEQYSSNIKPVVLSEVSGTAFRFGHSTVQGHFRIQHRHAPTETVPLHRTFNDPSRVLTPTSFDDYLFSLGAQPQQQVDPSITLGLTGFLFAGQNPFGSDLASLNIQRGRDHALRPYNDYRAWAGLPKIQSFDELGQAGVKLAQVYESPDDIDLFVGALVVESGSKNSLVGETFGHLISEQFARLKYGDRFYYKNGPKVNPGAFKPHQLEQIERVSLAGIICANVDRRFDFYQAPRAFFKSGLDNEPISCEKFHGLDLRAWKD
ncbi:chorion peroxidase-like [Culex pipiens pallens]|uniref:chorion peroxidase-like n=1 Tax=Culex pipiens pallens TaxID=42434 RepID=UPI00195377FF|nr:chorion peroxidase-like [Culex pipiens pallens]